MVYHVDVEAPVEVAATEDDEVLSLPLLLPVSLPFPLDLPFTKKLVSPFCLALALPLALDHVHVHVIRAEVLIGIMRRRRSRCG